MSIESTSPAMRVNGILGDVVTVDKDGIRNFFETEDRRTAELLRELIEEVKLLRLAIYELNNA
jgi:hypothetical protein